MARYSFNNKSDLHTGTVANPTEAVYSRSIRDSIPWLFVTEHNSANSQRPRQSHLIHNRMKSPWSLCVYAVLLCNHDVPGSM